MRNGLPHDLLLYLKTVGWTAKNDLTSLKFPTKKGGVYGADLIGRKLRNLEEESMIAVRYENGHAHYKYVPSYLRELYIPISQRTGEKMWRDENEVKRLLGFYNSIAA